MNLMGFNVEASATTTSTRGRTTSAPRSSRWRPIRSCRRTSSTPTARRRPSGAVAGLQVLDGAKFGIVGFTNEDSPTLTKPGAFDPFHVGTRPPAVNAEAAKLKAQKIDDIVAIGHLGATGGTLTNPTGRCSTWPTTSSKSTRSIGDHTDFQVLTTRSNGVLVTENRSKGIRFTRVRLVVDPSTKAVVYKTADFHKPWDIGVTPDPAIQAQIDDLNAQLAPIFNTVVGESTVVVPRADACGATADRRPGVRVAGRRPRDGRDRGRRTASDFAHHQLRRPAGRPDLPGGPTTRGDFCPAASIRCPSAGHYPITRGQVLGVLPFGNVVGDADDQRRRAEGLPRDRRVLAAGHRQRPVRQVSGLCFTFDIEGAPATVRRTGLVIPGTGSRVVGAVRQAANGSCTGAAVNLTRGVDLHAGDERLHRRRRRRLPGLPEPDDDAGHPRPGSRGLHRRPAGRRHQPGDPASDPLHGQQPGGGAACPSVRRKAS